ncbi:MAG: mercury resistance system transport protein MerF, partial [Alphaproteobacteria bacterium]|nr:mercury resistance system transport protein MerF [Alphaproteobacteria bacterium]
SAIAAVCCFTPALVILVTAVGLSAVIGYLDYVLFPALAFFLALTAYGVYRMKRPARDEESAS